MVRANPSFGSGNLLAGNPFNRRCLCTDTLLPSARFRISFLFLLQSMVFRSALLNQCFACPFCNSHQVGSPHQSYRDARGLDRGAFGDCRKMQQLADVDANADRVDLRPSRKRKASARRKVTVRLSEGVCGRLDVATDRPGVGKSMVVEVALEHFLNPAPSVEALMRERLHDMHARFDDLARDMRMIAETVALHARYHLAVMPPVPESRQREAVILGNELFRGLGEQGGRRVREGRPLMQETIDRLNSAQQDESDQATGERPTHNSTP